MRILIACPQSLVGGANTEALEIVSLLRARGVDVLIVWWKKIPPDVGAPLVEVGCHFAEYKPEIFKDQVVAAWNSRPFLESLHEVVGRGKPHLILWMNCMTVLAAYEIALHKLGLIDRWGFISNHQRKMIKPRLEPFRPVVEFEGYRPYFDPDSRFHDIRYLPRRAMDEFVVGRISRDDPSKFAQDTYRMFSEVEPGRKKRVLMLGRCSYAKLGTPPESFEIHPAGTMSSGSFYRQTHAVMHKTGGSGESYCRVIIECYAAGTIFIGERAYALPELILDGETGFLCDTSAEMVDRANELARDEPLRRRIAERARDHLFAGASDQDACWKAWENVLSS